MQRAIAWPALRPGLAVALLDVQFLVDSIPHEYPTDCQVDWRPDGYLDFSSASPGKSTKVAPWICDPPEAPARLIVSGGASFVDCPGLRS